MKEVNQLNFSNEVLRESKRLPVLVEFGAEWCAPCTAISKVLEQMETTTYKNKVVFAKVDIEKNIGLAFKYKVSTLPTIKLFKDGKIAGDVFGGISESSVRHFLNSNI